MSYWEHCCSPSGPSGRSLLVARPNSVLCPLRVEEHNENDGGAVYTFQAVDPDAGDTIFWTLSGTDADDFMIENGVLKFKSAPDFEIPLDENHRQHARSSLRRASTKSQCGSVTAGTPLSMT